MTMRPDEVRSEATPPQSLSSADQVRLPAEPRDVLREAGIEYSITSSPDDPHVVVRRADVERLIREVTEAHNVLTLIAGVPVEGTLAERVGVLVARASTLASARAIRASMDARRTPAGLSSCPVEDVSAPAVTELRDAQWMARLTDVELIANAREVIEAASRKLSALCHGERWTMSVPVQDSDSDVALGRVIALARLLSRRQSAPNGGQNG